MNAILSEDELRSLRSLENRTLAFIAANQLHIQTRSVWADTLCLALVGEGEDMGGWDSENDFITFLAQDEDIDDQASVYATLSVHRGIEASGIPFDQYSKAPGPLSSIECDTRFTIQHLQLVSCRLTLPKSCAGSGHNLSEERSAVIEAGVIFTSSEGSKFLIYVEQTGDLYHVRGEQIPGILESETPATGLPRISMGLGRVLF